MALPYPPPPSFATPPFNCKIHILDFCLNPASGTTKIPARASLFTAASSGGRPRKAAGLGANGNPLSWGAQPRLPSPGPGTCVGLPILLPRPPWCLSAFRARPPDPSWAASSPGEKRLRRPRVLPEIFASGLENPRWTWLGVLRAEQGDFGERRGKAEAAAERTQNAKPFAAGARSKTRLPRLLQAGGTHGAWPPPWPARSARGTRGSQ